MMLGHQKDTLLVFVLLAITYGYFYHNPSWNGNSRIGLIFAIVQEGRLTIDSFHDQKGTKTGDKSFYQGHYYSDKAIGTSLVGATVYLPMYWLMHLLGYNLNLWIVKYLLTFFVIGLPSALAGSLIYVVCKCISASRLRAFVVTVAITLGTLYLPFSVVFFGHQLAASLLFGAFFLIFQLKVTPDLWTKRHLFLIGLVLGLALITEYTTPVIVVPLSIYYVYVLWTGQSVRRMMSVALPAVGGLIPVAILLLYNTLCFGNPLSIGYEHKYDPVQAMSMAQGLWSIRWPRPKVLYYLTVHPAQGLFWQSPVLIMALIGAWFMFRAKQYRAEAVLATVAFLSYLLINSGYSHAGAWWSGWSFGPRYIVPMLPFLCLPLIFVPRRLFAFVVLLGVVSVSQMFIVAASTVVVPDHMLNRIDELSFFQYSSIYSYCLQQLVAGNYATNLGRKLFGLREWKSLLPLMLAILSTASMFLLMKSPRPGDLAQNVGHQLNKG